MVLCPISHSLRLLSRYVFLLAQYDINYDVRDRTRMLVSLLAGLLPSLDDEGNEVKEGRGGVVLRREQVKRVLFEGKTNPVEEDAVVGMWCVQNLPVLYLIPVCWCR